MMDAYFVPTRDSETELVEKKSRFIGRIWVTETEEEALEHIKDMRTKHWDATHNVYAYILRDNSAKFSDDGEPHSTAGKPVYEVLLHSGITDALMIVTRYFGGILLGTGGLTRAYSTAASMGIEKAGPCRMALLELYHVQLEYSVSEKFQYAAKKNGFALGDIIYDATPIIPVYCAKEDKEKLIALVNDTTAGRGKMTHIGSSSTKIDA